MERDELLVEGSPTFVTYYFIALTLMGKAALNDKWFYKVAGSEIPIHD